MSRQQPNGCSSRFSSCFFLPCWWAVLCSREGTCAWTGAIAEGQPVPQRLFLVAWAVAWFLGAHHVPNFDEFSFHFEFLVLGGGFFCFTWLLYIALEPYVRRRWPATLVSWSRLLAGGFRDPLVGRDLLAGCLLDRFWAPLKDYCGLFPPGWAILRPTHSGARLAVSRCADDDCCYIELLGGRACFLACASVCPVPSPGLATQRVGGGGSVRSFMHLLSRRAASLSPLPRWVG